IVVAIARERERARLHLRALAILLDEDLVLHAVELLQVAPRVLHALARQVVVDLADGHYLAVDRDPLVAVLDAISGQPDHALDVVERGIVREAEYHHIAALRVADLDYLGIDHRQADAVGVL